MKSKKTENFYLIKDKIINKKLSIEQEIENSENNSCFFCKETLTDSNVSAWGALVVIKDKPTSVRQCVICNEAQDRRLRNSKKTGTGDLDWTPVQPLEYYIQEIKAEGITIETLKELEESQFNVKH